MIFAAKKFHDSVFEFIEFIILYTNMDIYTINPTTPIFVNFDTK